jgi:homoserine O-acetyltransferase
MDYAVAMDGSPKMTSYDILQWQSHREVIQTLQQHNVPNPKIMELVNLLGMLTAWTPDYFVENIPAEDIAKFIHEEQANQAGTHPDDYVAQLSAMINHDIYTASGKSEQQMASFIKADMLVVSVSSDHMANPATALKLANALGAEKLVLDSNCGHLGTTCELDHVAARVKNFLNKPAKRIAKVP